jgi:putative endonuclease
MAETEYSVYIIRCADDTLYTGIAVDVERRIGEHESSPRGAKYLKGRGPLKLMFSQAVGDRALASRFEYRVKKLSRLEKQALIDGRQTLVALIPNQNSEAGCA